MLSLILFSFISKEKKLFLMWFLFSNQTFLNSWSICTSHCLSGLIDLVSRNQHHITDIGNCRLVCIITSLILCLLSISKLPILVSTACYTNLYVPLSRLNTEILGPLEQEIRGLQAFRQPTAEEFQKAGSMCPVCLDAMHIARITPCGHIFHSHCLRQCLTRSRNCPCCRTQIL